MNLKSNRHCSHLSFWSLSSSSESLNCCGHFDYQMPINSFRDISNYSVAVLNFSSFLHFLFPSGFEHITVESSVQSLVTSCNKPEIRSEALECLIFIVLSTLTFSRIHVCAHRYRTPNVYSRRCRREHWVAVFPESELICSLLQLQTFMARKLRWFVSPHYFSLS